MILVYSPGVWDLLHVGHLAYLERARALGDRLAVGVPSDEVVRLDKGRPPAVPLAERLRLLAALRCVDLAVPYYALEFLTHLELFRPDVLCVGEGWGGAARHEEAEGWAAACGCRVVRLPRTPGVSTTILRRKAEA